MKLGTRPLAMPKVPQRELLTLLRKRIMNNHLPLADELKLRKDNSGTIKFSDRDRVFVQLRLKLFCYN